MTKFTNYKNPFDFETLIICRFFGVEEPTIQKVYEIRIPFTPIEEKLIYHKRYFEYN